jgi:hypothetical protein
MNTEEENLLELRREQRPKQQNEVASEKDRVTQRDEILKGLLSKVEGKNDWIEVTVPSGPVIKVRPITYKDESGMRAQITGANAGTAVTRMLEGCVECDWNQLYMFDKNFLIFKLREISYGDDYTIEGTCECTAKTELNLKLSDLPVKPYDGNGEITVPLPDSEIEAVVRVPSVQDQKLFDDITKLPHVLWRFVKSLGGETDTDIIQAFLGKTTLKDVLTIQQSVFELDYGLTSTVWYKCSECNRNNELPIPLNESFFSVS